MPDDVTMPREPIIEEQLQKWEEIEKAMRIYGKEPANSVLTPKEAIVDECTSED